MGYKRFIKPEKLNLLTKIDVMHIIIAQYVYCFLPFVQLTKKL